MWSKTWSLPDYPGELTALGSVPCDALVESTLPLWIPPYYRHMYH